jgi:outer membrane receptor protein involved in Fe transport
MLSSVASRSVLVIALASASSLAQAQDMAQPGANGAAEQAATPAQGTDEIVVTAQRREQRLQDVPVSVSVVSGAALEKAGVRNLQESATRLPAVRIVEGPAADLLNIRGIARGRTRVSSSLWLPSSMVSIAGVAGLCARRCSTSTESRF